MLCCCRERSPNRSLPAQRKSKSPSPAAEKNGTGIPTATSESPLTTPETPLPITCNNNNSVSPDSVTLSVGTEEVDPKMAAELANLVSRLEAVTNRLESVAAHGGAGGAGAGGKISGQSSFFMFLRSLAEQVSIDCHHGPVLTAFYSKN